MLPYSFPETLLYSFKYAVLVDYSVVYSVLGWGTLPWFNDRRGVVFYSTRSKESDIATWHSVRRLEA